MAPQFIFTMRDLPPGPSARQGGAARHQHLDVPGRQDRRARPERRRASRRCCGSSPARTTATAARCGSRPASPSATCPRSRSSTPTKDVLGNVTDGVARHEGPARPLRGGLHRDGRARRRLRQAARRAARAPGQDRRASTAGISTASSRSRWTRCASRRPTPTSRSCRW